MEKARSAGRNVIGRRRPDAGRGRPVHRRVLRAGQRIPQPDWSAAGWAGMVGGSAYLFLELVARPLLLGTSPGAAMREIAAIGLGPQVLRAPAAFDPLAFVTMFVVNFTLSMLYTRLSAPVWARVDSRRAAALGFALGCGLYAVNYDVLTALFPWFRADRGALTLLANAAFGLVAALVYKQFERSPAAR